MNDFFRTPLLKTFERVLDMFDARVYVAKHGKISPYQATRLLHKLTENGILRKIGERKETVYERGPLL